MNREEFDALAQRRLTAMAEALPAGANVTGDPASDVERKRATEEVQLAEAQWSDFADAVDRSGKTVAYEDAVVISGGAGQTVCTQQEWKANRAYWETVAAGASGEVDWVADGAAVLTYLRANPPA